MSARSVLFANDFPPVTSGISTYLSKLWQHMPPDRAEVFAPKVTGSELVDAAFPVAVHRVPMPLGENLPAKLVKSAVPAAWLLNRILDRTPSKLHCGQVFSSGWLGYACKKWFGIPYVVYVYGSETARLAGSARTQDLMTSILNEAEHVVADSDSTKDEFRDFGIPRDKLMRIYPGVDPLVFAPSPPDPVWVKRLGLEGKRVLLTVARLDQRKGHDTVIRAMPDLPDDVVYLIPSRGREEDRLKALVTELGQDDRIQFLGFVSDDDLPKLYNLCDIHVMPNRVTEGTELAGDLEGFGITFVEAGACGKPVIGGRSGGAVESVLHGQTGLLVDPTSGEEVVQAILSLLDNPDEARQLGSQARERVERELDWRILAEDLRAIL
jgi:phosphatidyl-myo-inositol dimannoside synthase